MGVVSYYVVYVTADGKEKLRIIARTNELKYELKCESEAIHRYGNIHVQVHAVNDAGVGLSATVTISFFQFSYSKRAR